MEWKDLTIEQAQYIYSLTKQVTDEVSFFDIQVKVLSYLTNTTEDEVNTWELDKYNKELEKINFIYHPIKERKPVQYLRINGHRYLITYNMTEVSYGVYNEVMKFSEGEDGVVNNLHKIMASVVTPIGVFGKKLKKNHPKISEDMLKAPFVECYSVAVFFYQVYNRFLKVIQPYLEKELQGKVNNPKQTVQALYQVMDGFTPQNN